MKKTIIPILALLLTSCAVTDYYQVYKTTPENGTVHKNKILFEDNNCSVYYDLWTDGGSVHFSIYNKTENDLTVHLNKTFFVLNGVAYEYFQNRTFSKLSNNQKKITSFGYLFDWNDKDSEVVEVAGTKATGFSTSYIEKPEITIPPKTLINISEFNVTNKFYTDCELVKYPSRDNIKTLKFSRDNSPFIFYNLITYSSKSDTLRLENKFYVSEITNYPSTEITTKIDTSDCGRKLSTPFHVFKNAAPDKFYIQYTRGR